MYRCQFTTACDIRQPHNTSIDTNFDRMLRGFWIGMNRVWGTILNHNTIDDNVYCVWSDRTACDFGAFKNGSASVTTSSPPWTLGNPKGSNRSES